MFEETKEARRAVFAVRLGELLDGYPASVTSWWRTPERNADVGGSPRSYHLEGLAADLIPRAARPWDAMIHAARVLGFDVADEGDHLHIELDYRHNRG